MMLEHEPAQFPIRLGNSKRDRRWTGNLVPDKKTQKKKKTQLERFTEWK